ncbi:hypothetical protein ES707_07658 [subsurface metagenome]
MGEVGQDKEGQQTPEIGEKFRLLDDKNFFLAAYF